MNFEVIVVDGPESLYYVSGRKESEEVIGIGVEYTTELTRVHILKEGTVGNLKV